MSNQFKPSPIEPKILPLVNAINQLNIVKTFSSCEGHYEDDEQELMDRNKADVRFDPLPGIGLDKVERFITYLMTEFNKLYSFAPITLTGYKLYAPNDEYECDFTFVIELKPFDRFNSPLQNRKDTDKAIKGVIELVKKHNESGAELKEK